MPETFGNAIHTIKTSINNAEMSIASLTTNINRDEVALQAQKAKREVLRKTVEENKAAVRLLESAFDSPDEELPNAEALTHLPPEDAH